MPPIAYPCQWCTKKGINDPVRVSYSNPHGNLKAHRDGSKQAGRSDTGCLGRNKAWETEPELQVPLSVAETCKKTSSSLDNFVVATPQITFSNNTFNQMACAWLIRQAQPWSRVQDPILRGMVRYLWKEASLYGRWWVADEAKSMNRGLKASVFAELKVCHQYQFLDQ